MTESDGTRMTDSKNTQTFKVEGQAYEADLTIAEKPTPKFLRLTKKMQALAEKGEDMTEEEGVDSILLASDYLATFGIDAEDLPAETLFQVLAGLFQSMEDQPEAEPANRAERRAAAKTKA